MPATPAGSAMPVRELRLRVLVPLTVSIVALLAASVWMFVRQTRHRRGEDVARTAALVDDLMHAQLGEGVAVMRSVMELWMGEAEVAAALRARDRQTLLRLSAPVLEDLRARNAISHFYYILPDRTMLLRVQLPDEWGDRIDRFVLREAQRTGKPFWGNEQGPFGSLTLRVTYPWFDGGEVIGYLEMGIEFEALMERVHRLLDADVFVAIEKRFLDRAKWDRMQRKLGRHVSWDEFPDVLVLSRTVETIAAPIASHLRAARGGGGKSAFEVAWGDRVSQMVVLPFLDLRGRALGEIVVVRDITGAAAEVRQAIGVVVLVSVVLGGGLLAFFFALLGRVQREITLRTTELQASNERLALEILERTRAERVLEEHSRALGRSNAELEQLVYVASHDLQEPLRAVTSYLQLVEQRYKDLDPETNLFIGHAVAGAKRMKTLMVDLLTYSRIGERAQPFGPTDCEAVLATALGHLAPAIRESGARITHEPLPIVIGDATLLLQVFQNLLGNAIKFRRPEAPPEIHIRAARVPSGAAESAAPPPSAGASDAEPWWAFSVRDNGLGIEPQHFERIFVLFQRLQAVRGVAGTGIGLAICKKVVERHRGRIWVESTPGSGSTFFFTLPGVPG